MCSPIKVEFKNGPSGGDPTGIFSSYHFRVVKFVEVRENIPSLSDILLHARGFLWHSELFRHNILSNELSQNLSHNLLTLSSSWKTQLFYPSKHPSKHVGAGDSKGFWDGGGRKDSSNSPWIATYRCSWPIPTRIYSKYGTRPLRYRGIPKRGGWCFPLPLCIDNIYW